MADIEVMEEPDEGVLLEDVEEEEEETPFVYDDDSPNLARDFMDHPIGKVELKKIAETVRSNFDSGYRDSEGFRTRFMNDWKLFTGVLPPKEWPWKDAANVHVPLMMEHTTRLCARATGELFGDWQNVFGVVPMGPQDDQTASILNKHGNWQIREQIPDFRRQIGDRGVLAFFWIGDVAVHSYYDEEREQNRHEVLTPDEFVIPFTFTSTMPDYSDCPWVCKIMNRYRHELEAKSGEWFDVDKIIDGPIPSAEDSPVQDMADVVAGAQGTEISDNEGNKQTANAPYKLLQYEGWMRLPNQERDRFVQVILHHETQTVLKMTIHEEDDWQDAERFRRQTSELEGFRTQQLFHSQQLTELEQTQQAIMQSHDSGLAGPDLTSAGMEQIQQQIPPVPVPPHWLQAPEDPMSGPEPPKRVPVHMFTHIVCIEPFVGALGNSYGRMQADYNRAANVLTSQFVDAGTLANVKSFLTTDTVDFGEAKAVGPGSVRKVKGVIGDDLQKNIMPLQFAPANPQLMEMVDRIYGWARTSMQAPEVLSGEPGKSGETYRGISARIEQATKQLSVYTRKYADGLENILKNNAKLNAKFLKDEEIINIASHVGSKAEPVKVSRSMYDRDYRIQIRADLRFATQAQRIQEADELAGFAMKFPQLAANQAFTDAVIKKGLRARGFDDMVEIMDQAPPPPPPGATPPGGPPGGPPQGAPPGMPAGGPPPMGQMGPA